MHSIAVPLPDNPYEIVIAANNLDPAEICFAESLGDRLKNLKIGKKVLVVSNPEIFALYGDKVVNSTKNAGFEVFSHLIPAGEDYKHLESIAHLYDTALENYLERSSTLLALGGGVIGDMTGFAAATWLRGINFVQVPTTLLAMVDASIGGKTGVNHPKGKNLIGAFYQPKLVYIDPVVLKTLPVREFRAGMAEVIKYGVIWDEELFLQLEAAEKLDNLSDISPELLNSIITRSCQAKVDVVSQDEKEAGLRAILNYGHTIGHAIESLTGYTSVNHGEAVGIGMVAAGKLALALGLWTQTESDRQNKLIQKTNLPTAIPSGIEIAAIIDALKSDKKVKEGVARFVLPSQIGKAKEGYTVPANLIENLAI
jgi:3-dehydroquinate synthase